MRLGVGAAAALESVTAMKAHLLDPQTLLSAYAQGVFPMADRDGSIRLYTADPRGVLPLESFHVPHTLRQLVRRPPERCRYWRSA